MGLQEWPFIVIQQIVDGVAVKMDYLIALVLGLGG